MITISGADASAPRAHTLVHALINRRLVPAYEGGVGASRGEVDAGVLNTLVLAVEQVGGRNVYRGGSTMSCVCSSLPPRLGGLRSWDVLNGSRRSA